MQGDHFFLRNESYTCDFLKNVPARLIKLSKNRLFKEKCA